MPKKSRRDINRDYYAKKAAKQPATRSSSVPTSRTPAKKEPLPFANAEPPTPIGSIPWLSGLDPDEVLDYMGQDSLWRNCFAQGLDPLWAYRYLCQRLRHHPKQNWRLTRSVPGPNQVFRVVKEEVERELVLGGEADVE